MRPKPPVNSSAQLAPERTNGRSASAMASGPPAASACHSVVRRAPTHGSASSHAGGSGNPSRVMALTISSPSIDACSNTATARLNGTMKIARMTNVITVVAMTRRPPVRRSTRSINGHVATTIVVAQAKALKKGNNVQMLPTINPVVIRISRSVRVRSVRPGVCMVTSS